MNKSMQKITPFLWFNDNAEEAINFYVSIFSAGGGSDEDEQKAKGQVNAPLPHGSKDSE